MPLATETEDACPGPSSSTLDIISDPCDLISYLKEMGHVANYAGERQLVVGMVGYPNVGKSSTINKLVGSKKVSVSATPGKTRHFQTIHIDSQVLCSRYIYIIFL